MFSKATDMQVAKNAKKCYGIASSDPRTDEDSSPKLGTGMPETSSFISLTVQNHINNL
jgi:hypothetical protein